MKCFAPLIRKSTPDFSPIYRPQRISVIDLNVYFRRSRAQTAFAGPDTPPSSGCLPELLARSGIRLPKEDPL